MWTLLQRNLAGLSEGEADWRPHPAANSARWILGHLAWFEEWAHDALLLEGRYRVDSNPNAYLEGLIPELMVRFAESRARYRESSLRPVVARLRDGRTMLTPTAH